MKTVAILLVLTVLVAGTAIGYLYMSSNVTIDHVNVVAVDGADQTELFENLKGQIRENRLIGTPFQTADLGEADEYVFYRYTVTLKNDTAVKAEAAELQITPLEGDVLQMGDTEEHVIRAGTTGEITGVLLTGKDSKNVRELTVSFYIWGLPFTLKTTYGK